MQADVASALVEAANLLLVGMVVVFTFLTMLIGAVNLITWLNSLLPEEQATQTPTVASRASVSNHQGQQPSPKVVAAIGAAIRQYRRNH